MRSILWGNDEAVKRWVGGQLGIDDFGPSTAMGVLLNGEMIGGSVYNNYRGHSVEWTFASTNPLWASRQIFACIFHYPFVQLGCVRLSAYTKAKNNRARTSLLRLGFSEEGYHPSGFSDDDAVSYGLLRKDCRWIGHGTDEVSP